MLQFLIVKVAGAEVVNVIIIISELSLVLLLIMRKTKSLKTPKTFGDKILTVIITYIPYDIVTMIRNVPVL